MQAPIDTKQKKQATIDDKQKKKQAPIDDLEAQPIGDHEKLKQAQAYCTERVNAHRRKWWAELWSPLSWGLLFTYAMWALVALSYIPFELGVAAGVVGGFLLIGYAGWVVHRRNEAIHKYRHLADWVGDGLEAKDPVALADLAQRAQKAKHAINQHCRDRGLWVDTN